jgi:hypothetical protein
MPAGQPVKTVSLDRAGWLLGMLDGDGGLSFFLEGSIFVQSADRWRRRSSSEGAVEAVGLGPRFVLLVDSQRTLEHRQI